MNCCELIDNQDKQLKLVRRELTHFILLCIRKMEDEKLAEHAEWWNVANEVYQSSIALMEVLYPDFAKEFIDKDFSEIDISKVEKIAHEVRYED